MKTEEYIQIKDKKIRIMIRSYKRSNQIKIYFVGNVLKINKPYLFSYKRVLKLIKQNEQDIYNQYIEILSLENTNIKHWYTGEKILYNGEEYTIVINTVDKNRLQIFIENENKQLNIIVPNNIDEDIRKKAIDRLVKKLFKNNTLVLIQDRLQYWSKITNIQYKSFRITDATTRFGSCKPKTKELFFNLRLVMLPIDKVDAIIVHELCHIVHDGHNKEFYDLVKSYISNYKEIDKWLKTNSKLIII